MTPSPSAAAAHLDQARENRRAAADFVRRRAGDEPREIAVVAGSGLGTFSDLLEIEDEIPYGEIPGFAASTVAGHKGALLLARAEGKPLTVLSGRSHLYEGHSAEKAVFAVRVAAELGAKTLIVSNAAGGLNPGFEVGDLMLIRDHINLMWQNPLIGPNDDAQGPRFPDMSEPYDRALGDLALEIALEQGIPMRQGVYLAGLGPSYETRAEVKMLAMMGADVVGMSTVIETIAAVHAGLRVLGITLVSNSLVAAGAEVTHEEVMEAGRKASGHFGRLVKTIVGRI